MLPYAPDEVASNGEPERNAMLKNEALACLERMRLIAADETPALWPLAGHGSTTVLKVETGGTVCCMKRPLLKLRAAQDRFARLDRSQAETAWLRVAKDIVPGCVPMLTKENPETHSYAMEHLNPAAYSPCKRQCSLYPRMGGGQP